ncbi:type IV pilus biogenesis/stability protein PilW [Candidatus Pantoea deserta]|uniref:Type IV pilus biogenesis/stability protein PilW n=1 Tax=Candidatus Pantoea deserta TaxID=1869313 RepID=A0A3N4P0X6_9GAMM|nr:type IV pilus biogenesis/stability protein PilW [Pantoea deserta]RPE02283.1 type IV pilus biogenesis/stability protein PilW [Pantoea deserta]
MGKGLPASLLALIVVTGCVSRNPYSGAAETRLALGMHYLAAGDVAAASRNLRRAEAAAPRDYRMPLALARLAEKQGNRAEAARLYQRAQQLAPTNGYIANNYGAFLCALGQYDEAHQQFKRAMDASESEARTDAWELSGYCYLQADDAQAARAALSQALAANRAKGEALLDEAEKQRVLYPARALLLTELYQQYLPATARSLELQIRFAAQQGNAADVTRYGDRLARSFPQSIQYQRYLANEY